MDKEQMELQNALAGINWKNAQDVECAKKDCDSKAFIQAYEVKRLSPIVSPTGSELVVPMAAFACFKCGHIAEALRMGPTKDEMNNNE